MSHFYEQARTKGIDPSPPAARCDVYVTAPARQTKLIRKEREGVVVVG